MKKLLFISTVLLLCHLNFTCDSSTQIIAQPEIKGKGIFEGNVIDNYTSRIIPLASIMTAPETDTMLTNNSGYFSSDSILEGMYRVICQKSGFELDTQVVSVFPDSITQVNFKLDHNDFFAITDSLVYHLNEDNIHVKMTVQNSTDSSQYVLVCSQLMWTIEKHNGLEWEEFSASGHFFICGPTWNEIPPGGKRVFFFIDFETGRFRINFPHTASIIQNHVGTIFYSNEFEIY